VKNQNITGQAPVRLVFFGLVVIAILAIPLPAFAQGCALCYTQAASAGHKMIDALRSGILILVAPPTLASVGMIFVLRRKSNQIRREEDRKESSEKW
jgi:hypothetical protein